MAALSAPSTIHLPFSRMRHAFAAFAPRELSDAPIAAALSLRRCSESGEIFARKCGHIARC
jgi:hypothetical protein